MRRTVDAGDKVVLTERQRARHPFMLPEQEPVRAYSSISGVAVYSRFDPLFVFDIGLSNGRVMQRQREPGVLLFSTRHRRCLRSARR